jgi:hypothetical protein
MACEPEVVVRGEVDEPAAFPFDHGLDRPVDRDEPPPQPSFLPLRESAGQILVPGAGRMRSGPYDSR